ncbi:hypothetical protein [Xanthomonas arboricola]|uniref:hypothetical protein n=1 Tax=Xanthomonas arboricola TaxID=56448 RepID=UPI0011B09EF2|nr:hypothetical protein [Xanthomonas arboricola]
MITDLIKKIFKQPVSTWIIASACGAALATVLIDSRLPMRLLSIKGAADWASAFGSLAAAIVALHLGLGTIRRERKISTERSMQVAAVFHGAGLRALINLRKVVDVLKKKPTPERLKILINLSATDKWWHGQAPANLIHELPLPASLKASHSVQYSQMMCASIQNSDPEMQGERLDKKWNSLRKGINIYSLNLRSTCSEICKLLGRKRSWEDPDKIQHYSIPDEADEAS